MISVAGGIYREICQFPEAREIYGSGGRAAVSICELSGEVELYAYAPPSKRRDVGSSLGHYPNLRLNLRDSAVLPAFRYLHGLASPIPQPALNVIEKMEPISVNGEKVLRFGMVEGSARVEAESAVYDPQAPLSPELFSANSSTARHLAYVINESEARLLTKLDAAEAQVHWLHEHEGAEVVVLKCGPAGALVSHGGTIERIPCYKTPFVWPIGSGDTFSAAFSHFWMEAGMTPIKAAEKASLAAAYYCSTQSLPLPKDFDSQVAAQPLRFREKISAERCVYLAGPFFTVAQRWLIDSLLETFGGLGVSVFSPIHEVGEGDPNLVAKGDLDGLDKSQVLFAVLDGLDAGTLVEVGYAIAKGIPVVAFTQVEHDNNLTMLAGTGCVIERDLVTAMYKAAWIALEA